MKESDDSLSKGTFHSSPGSPSVQKTQMSTQTGKGGTWSRTPAFVAVHDGQYRRQELIKEIEQKTGRCLICYVGGLDTSVHRDDVVFFADLLHNLEPNKPLDLLLHTGGGDMDAAEKLISMIRQKVGNEELRIAIPDFAKSAGTLISLGADRLLMSDTSELGPIDPQIMLDDGKGNRSLTPIQSYLDAFTEYSNALIKDPQDPVARLMLSSFDPARLKSFEAARNRARKLAESILTNGMFRSPKGGNWSLTVSELLNTAKYPSHGQMIGVIEAKRIELLVDYFEPRDSLWELLWQLYSYQRFAIQNNQKLFESNFVSLSMES